MSMTKEQIEEAIAFQRQQIPERNLDNFNVEANDFLRHIQAARKLHSKRAYDIYAVWFWDRCRANKHRDLQHVPPTLIQRKRETIDQYMQRCYKAGGYGRI